MNEMWSLADGEKLIHFARENIEHYLTVGMKLDIPDSYIAKFSEKGGAFVTLNRSDVIGHDNPLRGCIGIILPYYPLIETIQNISISAAVEDSRFPNVTYDEMNNIVIEISILSVPEVIEVKTPEDYLNEIIIGRDGLIVTKGRHRGLLLPQVPVEHGRNWDPLTFLEQTCQKAWLNPDAWKDLRNTQIERFTATIFEETSPRGPIRRKEIGE